MKVPTEPLRMPHWYVLKCRAIGRALVGGQLTDDEASFLLELWHPIALRRACAARAWVDDRNAG